MMQDIETLVAIILESRPKTQRSEAVEWATYLQQLRGCHLLSAIGQDVDQAKWLKQRQVGIGGSEISAIMGENHWNSPRQIWMSKIGALDDKPAQQSEAARWGNVLETTVAEEWGIREKRQWIHIPVILQHDEFPWLLANIDGFTLSDDRKIITGILEIKTTSQFNADIWENGPLPCHYLDQANWYCGITGQPGFDLVCLVGGQKLYSYYIPFDEERFEEQKAAAYTFWNEYVLKFVEPPTTATDKNLLKAEAEPDEDLPPVILDDEESERVADAYCQIREKIGALEKVKDALHAQLQVMLGNSMLCLTKTRQLQLTKAGRRTCDFDLLEAKYPEAYNTAVTTKVFTQLRIK